MTALRNLAKPQLITPPTDKRPLNWPVDKDTTERPAAKKQKHHLEDISVPRRQPATSPGPSTPRSARRASDDKGPSPVPAPSVPILPATKARTRNLPARRSQRTTRSRAASARIAEAVAAEAEEDVEDDLEVEGGFPDEAGSDLFGDEDSEWSY